MRGIRSSSVLLCLLLALSTTSLPALAAGTGSYVSVSIEGVSFVPDASGPTLGKVQIPRGPVSCSAQGEITYYIQVDTLSVTNISASPVGIQVFLTQQLPMDNPFYAQNPVVRGEISGSYGPTDTVAQPGETLTWTLPGMCFAQPLLLGGASDMNGWITVETYDPSTGIMTSSDQMWDAGVLGYLIAKQNKPSDYAWYELFPADAAVATVTSVATGKVVRRAVLGPQTLGSHTWHFNHTNLAGRYRVQIRATDDRGRSKRSPSVSVKF